ncbi:hypothetical protein CSPX01_06598, partial [Colletotrichum filicis]
VQRPSLGALHRRVWAQTFCPRRRQTTVLRLAVACLALSRSTPYGYRKERQHILLYSPSVAPWKQSYYSIPIASSRLVEPAETQQKRRSPLVPAFFEAPRRYELVALLISMPCNAAEPLGRHAASQCQSHSAIRT